ncbi:MAG: hypothetical protein KBS70_04050 [Bacteroidales bacterium]|nr:hypothetical protein [Candidatus Colicola equi]
MARTAEECRNMGKKITKETAREMQKKGAEKRRLNAEGRELARAILRLAVSGKEQKEIAKELGLDESSPVSQEAAMDSAMLREAKSGNTTAYEKLMKKAGYMVDKIEAEHVVKDMPATKEESKRFLQKLNKE